MGFNPFGAFYVSQRLRDACVDYLVTCILKVLVLSSNLSRIR